MPCSTTAMCKRKNLQLDTFHQFLCEIRLVKGDILPQQFGIAKFSVT